MQLFYVPLVLRTNTNLRRPIMPEQLLTIYARRPVGEFMNRQRFMGTRFTQRWPLNRTLSSWYFLTKDLRRVFLKVGWNLFGRRMSNHIQIRAQNIKSSEFMIYIPDDTRPPLLMDIHHNIMYDGYLMDRTPIEVHHLSTVGILRGNKIIIIQLRLSNSRPIIPDLNENAVDPFVYPHSFNQ